MEEKQQQIKIAAIKAWELGFLHFLYAKGILTEEEYNGIMNIADEEHHQK